MTAILSSVDWNGVFTKIGSTAVVVAILGFIAQVIIKHLLSRDIAQYKANLKREADRELADARARVENALLEVRAEFDRQIETFRTELATRTALAERIRQEIVRWANPILGAVMELHRRLDNILKNEGYLALSPTVEKRVNSEWSITYEYFLPSTIFLFSQYFCWIRLLEEKLSFELFERHADKDAFFSKVYTVRRTLGSFPLKELQGLQGAGDRQVFGLQQQALGETLAVHDGTDLRCMRFSEFTDKWRETEFSRRFDPLTHFIDRLEPENQHRWKRLELMAEALGQMRLECERLLSIETS
jgi:hypothetical protein